ITPDPRYLFMSERHGEGLAHLVYGVTESGGFIQLTGEVGTGKTTLVRTLLGQMPSEIDVALILNPHLTALEFLQAICEELGVPLPDDRNSSKALVDALNLHLLNAHARGRRTILLVDEAQNLSAGVLEQLRLLTNLETAKQKLLQIILIAQPELRDLLSQNNLRQLAQRVTGRYHLEPLSRDEAARYIDHRIKVAGGLTEIFDQGAKREVYRLSGGIPRLMNVICDRALLGAYSRESRKVNKWMVRRAAAEVSGQKLTPMALKWAVPVVAAVGIVLALVGLWTLIDQKGPGPDTSETVRIPVAAADPHSRPAENPSGAQTEGRSFIDTEANELGLEDRLRAAGTGTSIESAMDTLFGLWSVDFDESSGSTACQQAEAKGLSCYFNRGSWSGIRQLDRPVMLTLTDSQGDTHQPVLVSLTDGAGELAIAGDRFTYSLDEISEMWFGQYLLVWRPPNGRNDIMRPGMRDPNVLWLRQSLAALDAGYRTENLDSDLFDDDLEETLMQFQRAHRLRIDGIAGEQTQILLNSLLGPGGTPQLVAQSR
ncbi:MAG TPA: AAA family ATPase, partial [Woeseiaceae bacterium]|nr:AAA family ATPase [Woeseiaceae bacterium]